MQKVLFILFFIFSCVYCNAQDIQVKDRQDYYNISKICYHGTVLYENLFDEPTQLCLSYKHIKGKMIKVNAINLMCIDIVLDSESYQMCYDDITYKIKTNRDFSVNHLCYDNKTGNLLFEVKYKGKYNVILNIFDEMFYNMILY